MSIYISGIEMPRTCYDCPFQVDECFGTIKCRYAKTWGSYSSRAVDCPLVPVPDHGRLIDADDVKRIVKEHDYVLRDPILNSTDRGMWTIGIFQAIDNATTIIPADEEKDE